ncbi:MAG: hypothetical protein ABIR37_03175 [Candidatus Saccharimonadales bacterium]
MASASIAVVAIVVVGAFLILTKAAGSIVSTEADSGTRSAQVSVVNDTTASGSKAVKFTAAPPVTGNCVGAANTPGGPDPWGGCWPGPQNTGYPHGLPGDTRTPVTLTPYTGTCSVHSDMVIDSQIIDCGMDVYNNVTIRNSLITQPINTNSDTAHLTIIDTEIDGGTSRYQSVGIGNLTLLRINAHNNQHAVHCNDTCDVRDSWMHDQYTVNTSDWHQNGYLSNGGNNHQVVHNVAMCQGNCSGNITFIPDANSNNVLVDRNLFQYSPTSSYCFYGGDSFETPTKTGIATNMTVSNNIFMRGANGNCGQYGPVTAFNASRTGNQWINNKWDNGTLLTP